MSGKPTQKVTKKNLSGANYMTNKIFDIMNKHAHYNSKKIKILQ